MYQPTTYEDRVLDDARSLDQDGDDQSRTRSRSAKTLLMGAFLVLVGFAVAFLRTASQIEGTRTVAVNRYSLAPMLGVFFGSIMIAHGSFGVLFGRRLADTALIIRVGYLVISIMISTALAIVGMLRCLP